MTRTIAISVDQLWRPQPGGIGTYVRGLARGLASLGDADLEVVGVAPRGDLAENAGLAIRISTAPLSARLLLRVWPRCALGVPRDANVVHATSMAGPFGGGRSDAVHSVAMHDMLWRDEASASTRSGVRFHERRLRLIAAHPGLRILVTSPGLGERLRAEGVDAQRIHEVRLGVDDDEVRAANGPDVAALLARHDVVGPFVFYAGTVEPRKNIERLIEAHRTAQRVEPAMGPLVIAGPPGWGDVSTFGAVELGLVSREMLKGLYRDASITAYVPKSEGWGLPPVEALHAGTRVVASTTTPSVRSNGEVVLVDPLDVDSIAAGLVAAARLDDGDVAIQRRRASVLELTWRNVALDHLASWT